MSKEILLETSLDLPPNHSFKLPNIPTPKESPNYLINMDPGSLEPMETALVQKVISTLSLEITNYVGDLSLIRVTSWFVRLNKLLQTRSKVIDPNLAKHPGYGFENIEIYRPNADFVDISQFISAINSRATEILMLLSLNQDLQFSTRSKIKIDFQDQTVRARIHYDTNLVDLLSDHSDGIHPFLKAFCQIFKLTKFDFSGLDAITRGDPSIAGIVQESLGILAELPFDLTQRLNVDKSKFNNIRREFVNKYSDLQSRAYEELRSLLLDSEKPINQAKNSTESIQDPEDPELLRLQELQVKFEKDLKSYTLTAQSALHSHKRNLGQIKGLNRDYHQEYQRYQGMVNLVKIQLKALQKQIEALQKPIAKIPETRLYLKQFLELVKYYKMDIEVATFENPNSVIERRTSLVEFLTMATSNDKMADFYGTFLDMDKKEILEAFKICTTYMNLPDSKDDSDTIMQNNFGKGADLSRVTIGQARLQTSINYSIQSSILVEPKGPDQAKLYFTSPKGAQSYYQSVLDKLLPEQTDISQDPGDQRGSNDTRFDYTPAKLMAQCNFSRPLNASTWFFDPKTADFKNYEPERLQTNQIASNQKLIILAGDLVVQLQTSAYIPIPAGGDIRFVGFRDLEQKNTPTILLLKHRQNYPWSLALDKVGEPVRLELVFRPSDSNLPSQARDWLFTDLVDLNAKRSSVGNLSKNPIFYENKPDSTCLLKTFFEGQPNNLGLTAFKQKISSLKQDLITKKINQTQAVNSLCTYLQSLKIPYNVSQQDYTQMTPLDKLTERLNQALGTEGKAICQDMSAILASCVSYLGLTVYQDNIFQGKHGLHFNIDAHDRVIVIADDRRLMIDPVKFTVTGPGSELVQTKRQNAVILYNKMQALRSSMPIPSMDLANLTTSKEHAGLSEMESTTNKIRRLADRLASQPEKFKFLNSFLRQNFINPLIYGSQIPQDLPNFEEALNKSGKQPTQQVNTSKDIGNSRAIVLNYLTSYKVCLGFIFDLYYNYKTDTFSQIPSPDMDFHKRQSEISQEYKAKLKLALSQSFPEEIKNSTQ